MAVKEMETLNLNYASTLKYIQAKRAIPVTDFPTVGFYFIKTVAQREDLQGNRFPVATVEWKKLESAAASIPNPKVHIFDIDNTLLEDLKEFPKVSDVAGFPSMKYIKGADSVSDYTGGRTVDDFVTWIKSKSGSSGGSRRRRRRHCSVRRKHKRHSLRKRKRTRKHK